MSGLALVVVALAAGAASGRAAKPVELALTDLQGARVSLRDYRGKVVVLNFWATWCGPCNAEMPLLVAADKEFRLRGVAFLGASLDDAKTIPRIPDFLRKYGVGFPVWTGATADHLARLRLGDAVPATAFLDRDGAIAARVSGQLRDAELKERIEWLLGDRAGPAPPAFVSHVPR